MGRVARCRFTPLLLIIVLGCAPPAPRVPSPAGLAFKPFAFAILEDWDKGDDLDDIARDFRLFRELGITEWRGSFGWDDYEPERGRFDLAWLERFVARAGREGIALRPYLAYTPAWAAKGGSDRDAWNDPPRDVAEWRRFVSRIAALVAPHPHVRSLEIYNEENVALWWDGSAEEYAAVLRAGAEAVRAAAPRLGVIVGGMVWPDADWLETACGDGTGTLVDVVAFHAYPETWTPDSVPLERYLGDSFAEDFLPASDEACGEKPVWVNETGYATTPGRTELQQAAWWARAVATFASAPRVEHVGVYEIKDRPTGKDVIGDAPNHYLGLTRADRRPKLAFHTVKLLARLYGNGGVAPPERRVGRRMVAGTADSVFQHVVLRPDGRQVLVAWSRTLPATVEYALPLPARRVTEHALDGSAKRFREYGAGRLRGVRLVPGVPRIFETFP